MLYSSDNFRKIDMLANIYFSVIFFICFLSCAKMFHMKQFFAMEHMFDYAPQYNY